MAAMDKGLVVMLQFISKFDESCQCIGIRLLFAITRRISASVSATYFPDDPFTDCELRFQKFHKFILFFYRRSTENVI